MSERHSYLQDPLFSKLFIELFDSVLLLEAFFDDTVHAEDVSDVEATFRTLGENVMVCNCRGETVGLVASVRC